MAKHKCRGTLIRGRRAPMLQLCPTCGVMRIHHPGSELYKCPVRKEVTAALREYKRANGRFWKNNLRRAWELNETISQELQEARNVIGPSRLEKIEL